MGGLGPSNADLGLTAETPRWANLGTMIPLANILDGAYLTHFRCSTVCTGHSRGRLGARA